MGTIGELKKEFKIMKLFYVWAFLGGLSGFLTPYIVIFFLNEGFSLFQLGLMLSLSAIAAIILEVPSGALADSLGRKKLVVSAYIIAGFVVVLAPLIRSFAILVAALLLITVSYILISGADEAWFVDCLRYRRKSKLTHAALSRRQSIYSAGSILSFSLAGLIVAKLSMDWLWYINGGMFIGIGLFLLIFGKEKTLYKQKSTLKEALMETSSGSKAAVKYVLDNQVLKNLVIISFISAMVVTTIGLVWQPLLLDLDVPLAWIGPVFALVSIAGVIFSNFSKKFSRLFGSFTDALLARQVFVAVIFLFMAFVTQKEIFIFLWFAYSILDALGAPILLALFHRHTPSRIRATAGSFRSMLYEAGAVIAPVASGYIADTYGLRSAVFLSAILGAVAVLFYLRIREPGSAKAGLVSAKNKR